MEEADQEPLILNMETDSNINTIINTGDTTEEIIQVKRSRGRPKTTEQQQ